jgi:hypothetical protein
MFGFKNAAAKLSQAEAERMLSRAIADAINEARKHLPKATVARIVKSAASGLAGELEDERLQRQWNLNPADSSFNLPMIISFPLRIRHWHRAALRRRSYFREVQAAAKSHANSSRCFSRRHDSGARVAAIHQTT